jgi:hypothetical protein
MTSEPSQTPSTAGPPESDPGKNLGVYLNDHLAGSVLGDQLARRCLRSNEGSKLGRFLARLVAEIGEDRAELERIMTRVGARRSRIKPALAWTAEKVGRLKLNGQLLGYSPLSRLVELEGLMLGISGKLALWVALRPVLGDDPRIEGIDLERLAERARAQRQTIERLRRRAADPRWDTIVAAILLQREAGGDLARLLRTIAAAQEDAARVEADARSLTAQARFTAWLVTLLPAGAALLAELASPGLVAGLLAHPLSAWLVATAAVLQVLAFTAIARLARSAR